MSLYYEDMGDTISRTDIQNAVQSGLHGMRNDITRISHIVDCVPRTAQDVRDVSRRLAALEKDINQIQNIVANTLGRPVNKRYPDPYVVGIANELNDLKIRFATIEKFAHQMSEYVRLHNEATREDRQYRTA